MAISFRPSHVRTIAAALVLACAIPAAATGVLRALDAAVPRIAARGSLTLPRSFTGPGGAEVPLTGASGITWLGDDRYATVLDNSDVIVLFRLSITDDGDPVDAADFRLLTLAERHDHEDICPCPPRLARRPDDCILVCEEDTSAIRAVSLADGAVVGDVPVPRALQTPTINRGIESLAVDPDGRHLWTTTEEGIPADGPPTSDTAGTTVRIVRLAVNDDGTVDESETQQFGYPVDPPHGFIRIFAGVPLSGVTALVALGECRLLVLERSGCPGLPPFETRIHVVDTTAARDVSDVEKDLAARRDQLLEKRLLWKEQTGSNLEGLCLGPQLPGGGRSLVAVSDNGGLGTPTQLVGLVLDERTEDARLPFAIGAGLVACAAVIARGGRAT
jgi:hypothetical protein